MVKCWNRPVTISPEEKEFAKLAIEWGEVLEQTSYYITYTGQRRPRHRTGGEVLEQTSYYITKHYSFALVNGEIG